MRIKSLSPLLLLLLLPGFAQGGATRQDDGDQALKRMQFMLKQLNEEKALLEIKIGELEKENEKLDDELDEAKDKISDLEITVQRRDATITDLNNTVDQREAKIERREGQLRDVIGKYQDAQLLIVRLNDEIARLNDSIEEKNAAIEEFDTKNSKLYEANLELLDLYKDKSVLDALLQSDGVTGLKQVEIENVLQEYRFKLEDNRISQEEKTKSLQLIEY